MKKVKRKKIHEALYYLLLVVVLVFISGALFLVSPLLFLGELIYLFLVLIVLGVALGAFLKGFLHDLDELTHTHHAGLVTIILIASALNFLSLTASFTIFTSKNLYFSLLSASVFTISFLIPYAYHYLKDKK